VAFFLQELVNGITNGALYALMALSFTMVYRVLKLLNFAQTPAAGASSSIC
jgi:branched-chain amino acid transport system permease protein